MNLPWSCYLPDGKSQILRHTKCQEGLRHKEEVHRRRKGQVVWSELSIVIETEIVCQIQFCQHVYFDVVAEPTETRLGRQSHLSSTTCLATLYPSGLRNKRLHRVVDDERHQKRPFRTFRRSTSSSSSCTPQRVRAGKWGQTVVNCGTRHLTKGVPLFLWDDRNRHCSRRRARENMCDSLCVASIVEFFLKTRNENRQVRPDVLINPVLPFRQSKKNPYYVRFSDTLLTFTTIINSGVKLMYKNGP